MRYFQLDFEPTSEQVSSVNADCVSGQSVGNAGSFYVAFDEKTYDQPAWLVGVEFTIPEETP